MAGTSTKRLISGVRVAGEERGLARCLQDLAGRCADIVIDYDTLGFFSPGDGLIMRAFHEGYYTQKFRLLK